MGKKGVILIGICIILSSIFLSFKINNKISFDGQFKALLRENGWGEVLGGGLDNSADTSSKVLNIVKGSFKNKLIEASVESGFDPSEYMGKNYNIEEYKYYLSKSGGQSPLTAIFCAYEGKIICAYITYSEIGVIRNFWPLSAKYSNIIKDIEKNRTYKP